MAIELSSDCLNFLDDDLTMRNYLALLVCILNPKMKYSRALRLFEIKSEGDKRTSQPIDKDKKTKLNIDINNTNKIKVLDVRINVFCEFENYKTLKKTLGLTKKQIKMYIVEENLFLDRYKFILE